MAKKKNTTKSNGNSNQTGEFSTMLLGPVMPPSMAYIQKLADDLVRWAREDNNAIKVSQFSSNLLITNATWFEWCGKYPVLEQANTIAKQVIGNRREIKALNGEFNANIVMQTMGMYDKEYKEHYEWKAKLRASEDNKSETKVVVIERFAEPESPKNVDVIESKVP